jgi:hypothetical protein
MSTGTEAHHPTREERVRARLDDPAVKTRIAEIQERITRGESGPTIGPEDLPRFLREQQGARLDDR